MHVKCRKVEGLAIQKRREQRYSTLTLPLKVPDSGYLSVPAAETANLPSSACLELKLAASKASFLVNSRSKKP